MVETMEEVWCRCSQFREPGHFPICLWECNRSNALQYSSRSRFELKIWTCKHSRSIQNRLQRQRNCPFGTSLNWAVWISLKSRLLRLWNWLWIVWLGFGLANSRSALPVFDRIRRRRASLSFCSCVEELLQSLQYHGGTRSARLPSSIGANRALQPESRPFPAFFWNEFTIYPVEQ